MHPLRVQWVPNNGQNVCMFGFSRKDLCVKCRVHTLCAAMLAHGENWQTIFFLFKKKYRNMQCKRVRKSEVMTSVDWSVCLCVCRGGGGGVLFVVQTKVCRGEEETTISNSLIIIIQKRRRRRSTALKYNYNKAHIL